MKKDFLSLCNWNLHDLEALFELAETLKAKQKSGTPHQLLSGKTLGMIFEKSSTRTRVSFEAGMVHLGGHALFLPSSNTQIGRGEPVKDTARCMSRYVDGMMIRTYSHEAVEEFAQYASIPVINGLTDMFHPCQLMADLFTVKERRQNYRELTYCWIGDGNNMANSWINAAMVFGFKLRMATPKAYAPNAEVMQKAADAGAQIVYTESPIEAAEGADVLSTDVWASMGQEEEQEERQKIFAGYQINAQLLGLANPECLVLHCLPAHRDEEITDEVIESRHSVIFDEAENRLHIQKAILVALMG